MKEYIYKLREKPEAIRKQYMFFFLLISMTFVFGIWVYGFTSRFNTGSSGEQINQDVRPFTLFGQSISKTYHNVTASAGSAFKKSDTNNENTNPYAEQKMIPLIVVDNPKQ